MPEDKEQPFYTGSVKINFTLDDSVLDEEQGASLAHLVFLNFEGESCE